MKLNKLCERLGCECLSNGSAEVRAVTEDSRRVGPGGVFVAVEGEHVDAHDFAKAAVSAGAVAVLGGRQGVAKLHGVPYLHSTRPRRDAALAAHALAGDPSRGMTVIGVTGTNGKSSTVFLIQKILERAGTAAANFGTMGYEIAGEVIDAPHTTPFGEDLAALFARAKAAGMEHVVMEVSSHALDQERVAGIHFDVAAFTNLTQDHLDYHASMGAYRDAKLKLFERIEKKHGFTVVNNGDAAAPRFAKASKAKCITFGKGGKVKGKAIEARKAGTVFRLKTPSGEGRVRLNLAGKHNVQNALCAAAVCTGLNVSFKRIVAGLEACPPVAGRFEPIHAGQNFHVIVDYAHTEDGLRNVLKAARKISKKRVITVFGCGGDRDKGKRPKMGAAAAELSDFAVLTSDNPRTEDPYRILLDTEQGLQQAGAQKGEDYEVIEPREEAIAYALGLAKKGDLVMVAGKGHEDYQIIGTERHHFDDREVIRTLLGEG